MVYTAPVTAPMSYSHVADCSHYQRITNIYLACNGIIGVLSIDGCYHVQRNAWIQREMAWKLLAKAEGRVEWVESIDGENLTGIC